MTASAPPHVVVLGGGIAGVAAAYWLTRSGDAAAGATGGTTPTVTLVEAGDRLGGKLRTEHFRGRPFDVGADAFLARVPWAVDLAHEVGLGDDLVSPATGTVRVWTGGRLRPLPEGLALGVPTRLVPLARSGVLSARGMARAALDLVLPASRHDDDASVAALVGARFGREVVDRLVDPLLSGVHAGDVDRLSVAAVVPQLAEATRSHRSLLLGLRAQARGAPVSGSPVFAGVRGGLSRLVDRLVERSPGVEVVLEETAVAVEPAGRRYRVGLASGRALAADAVVVAVPAHAAARVLAGAWPDAARELAAVEHASVAVIALAYARAALGRPLDGSGFLVPRTEDRLVKACTWSSSKWPDLSDADGVLLRCSVGRFGDDVAVVLADDELVARAHAELAEAMSLRAEPLETRVVRWERALPQYVVGHLDRVRRIEEALSGNRTIVLVGAAYEGVGIPAVLRRTREQALRVRRELGTRP